MVLNTQNHHHQHPSSGILNTTKQRFGIWNCSRPQVREEEPTQLGPLERANLNHWTGMYIYI
jgi:hypothetical protein